MVPGLEMTKAGAFDESEREAIYRAIRERRDVRRGFLPEPMPDELLMRLLEAAHNAPSVGLMQPWRFIVIRDLAVRQAVHNIFLDANQAGTCRLRGRTATELCRHEARGHTRSTAKSLHRVRLRE